MTENYDSKADTLEHIKLVNKLLCGFATELLKRASCHDNSKLGEPEKSAFDIATPRLRAMTYGSPEYRRSLDELKIALEHHYTLNSHHPEFYSNGIDGMNLLDIVEMFFDWWAATKRHPNGNILKSIELNKERFKMGEQLANILVNTTKTFGEF